MFLIRLYCPNNTLYHRTSFHLYSICRQFATKVSVKLKPPVVEEIRVTTNSKVLLKKTDDPEWKEARLDWSVIHQHYMKLSKIRLTTLVVVTTMAGYAIAPCPFDLSAFACCTLGTGLMSAAANAINQYHEVPYDAQMSRTKNRVIVTGKITPLHAVTFAAVTSVSGFFILYLNVNSLTAALGAANLLLYTCIYTPLKRISIVNTWVGSIVGALPPMMGWVGCTGTLDAGAWILAGILYAWQFPHFNALSWNLRPDYSRAGYRMMSVTNPDLCRRTALRYTAALTALSCLCPLVDLTNKTFPLQALPLNLYFTFLAWKFYKESDSSNSRKLFRFSLIQLPLLISLLLANKKKWFISKDENKKIETIAGNTSKDEIKKIDTVTTLPEKISIPSIIQLQ